MSDPSWCCKRCGWSAHHLKYNDKQRMYLLLGHCKGCIVGFTCGDCGDYSTDKKSFRTHINNCNMCKKCKLSFSSIEKLSAHCREHLQSSDQCREDLRSHDHSREDLRSRVRDSEDLQTALQCLKCNSSFPSSDALFRHCKKHLRRVYF
mgnify:CR=1 FL=1